MKTAGKKKSGGKKPVIKKTAVKKTAAGKAASRKKTTGSTAASNNKKALQSTPGTDEQARGRLLKLHSVMVINDVNTLHAGLLRFSEGDTNIIIDASSVEMIDTAVMQLLLAFVEHIKNNNRGIIWKNPSNEFCNRIKILGLSDDLGVEQTCNP